MDVIASAEGRIVPLSFTKIVQPIEAGVISDILVADGQAVQEGQLLMRVDPRLSQADATAMTKDAALRRLTLRRIDAETSDGAVVRRKDNPGESAESLTERIGVNALSLLKSPPLGPQTIAFHCHSPSRQRLLFVPVGYRIGLQTRSSSSTTKRIQFGFSP